MNPETNCSILFLLEAAFFSCAELIAISVCFSWLSVSLTRCAFLRYWRLNSRICTSHFVAVFIRSSVRHNIYFEVYNIYQVLFVHPSSPVMDQTKTFSADTSEIFLHSSSRVIRPFVSTPYCNIYQVLFVHPSSPVMDQTNKKSDTSAIFVHTSRPVMEQRVSGACPVTTDCIVAMSQQENNNSNKQKCFFVDTSAMFRLNDQGAAGIRMERPKGLLHL